MNRNSQSLLVGRMEKRTKRARGSNWIHAHTMALAELKREASFNKEGGRLVWERIAQILSSRFPGQIRTGAQCRRRWETLVKNYKPIEDYCVKSGAQDHRELGEGELASMKLATAYEQECYDIVEQVCSQRKRKERCDSDRMLTKRSKGSHSVRHDEQSTTINAQNPSSSSLEVDKLSSVPEMLSFFYENDCFMVEAMPPRQHGPVSHEFFQEPQVTHHEQSSPESTTTYAQVSSSPSSEVDKLSPEEEVPRLRNGNDGLVLEGTQQHGQVSQEPLTLESANLLAHTFLAEKGTQLGEPLQEDLWDSVDAMSIKSLTESEQYGTESVGLGTQQKEPLQGHVRDDSYENANASSARESNSPGIMFLSQPALQSERGRPHSLDLPEGRRPSAAPPSAQHWSCGMQLNDSRHPIIDSGATAAANRSLSVFLFLGAYAWLCTAIMAPCMSSRSADWTISRQSRRWSLKVILLKIRQFCHKCGRKNRTEGMEMESKQAVRLREKARKKALMPRKENVPPMLDAPSSTNAASATRGDKLQVLPVLPVPQMTQVLHEDTERISNSAAVDKKEEETISLKVERQQLGGKSSTKCVPVGKLCAELSRRLFSAFHGQSSH